MKKIGFIDYFLDNFHANNYPGWVRKTGRDFDVHLAWQEDTNKGKTLNEWCDEQNVKPASSIEQVVEECDVLLVLAPRNAEVHERLSELPLKSGKPVYIDKTFAEDRAMAQRMISLAEENGSPMMSSSALRFASELQNVVSDSHKDVSASFATTKGGGTSFGEYGVHQLEMLVMLMGTGAQRVMQAGDSTTHHMVIDYPDGRRACMTLNKREKFCLSAYYKDMNPVIIDDMGDFWTEFIVKLLNFFETAFPSIPTEQTLEVISLIEAGTHALNKPDTWIELER